MAKEIPRKLLNKVIYSITGEDVVEILEEMEILDQFSSKDLKELLYLVERKLELDFEEQLKSIIERKSGYLKELGSFFIESGTMLAIDPCYDLNQGYQARYIAKEGEWKAFLRKRENLNKELIVIHKDCVDDSFTWWPLGEVGVDSGQTGFFDLKGYKSGEFLSGMEPFKVFNNGVTAVTAYGDGVYECYYGGKSASQEGIAFKINYL